MQRVLPAVLFIFLKSTVSHGACPELGQELERTGGRVSKIVELNEKVRANQLDFLGQCESAGAEISSKIAVNAAGLSCESLKTADAVYSKMTMIGTKCQDAFHQFEERSEKLVALIAAEREAATDALKMILKSSVIRQACPNETKIAAEMQGDLNSATFMIENTHSVAESLSQKYLKFTSMSAALKSKSQQGNGNCGDLIADIATLSKAPNASARQLAPTPAGKSVNPGSTVTGEINRQTLASTKGIGLIAKKPAGSSASELAVKPEITERTTPLAASSSAFESTLFRSSGTIARPAGIADPGSDQLPSVGKALWENGHDGLAMNAGSEDASIANMETSRTPASVDNSEELLTPSPADLLKATASSSSGSKESAQRSLASADLPLEAEPGLGLYGGAQPASPSAGGSPISTGHAEAAEHPSADAEHDLAKSNSIETTLFLRVHHCYERNWGARVVVPLPGARLVVQGNAF